jgi:hypothetical protein
MTLLPDREAGRRERNGESVRSLAVIQPPCPFCDVPGERVFHRGR